MFMFDFKFGSERFSNGVYLFNILFLGLGASALCFVTWNYAVKILGAVRTSVYIYLIPVITVIVSAIILNDIITFRKYLSREAVTETAFSGLGAALCICGKCIC